MNLNSANAKHGSVTALYCRLSKDDDNEGESLSIENQKRLLSQYADENGYYNRRFYIDDGISGTTFNRPGVQSMFADIQNGEVKTVIVKDMSRFGRDYIQVGLYRDVIFPQSGVRFVAISDGYDSINNNNGANDFAPFKDIMNEWYAKDTSRKIKAVFKAKGCAGEHLTSNIPYGYKKNPENPKQWIIDEEAAEIVREIFTLRVQGLGISKISNLLTERKVLNPTAYKTLHNIVNRPYVEEIKDVWHPKSVERILTNQSYVGDTVNGQTERVSYKIKDRKLISPDEWQIIPDTHAAIIERDVWELVQKLHDGRRRNTKRTLEPPLLAGHLFCADCGRKMYFSNRQNRAKYYSCSGYSKRINSCNGHFIKSDDVEQLILAQAQEIIRYVTENEARFVEKVMENNVTEAQKQAKALKKAIDTSSRRVTEIDGVIAKLYEDKVTGEITASIFSKLIEKYTAEQTELNALIAANQKALSELECKKSDVHKFVKLVKKYANIEELSYEFLNEFLDKVLIHQIERIDGERVQKIDIFFNGVGQLSLDTDEG